MVATCIKTRVFHQEYSLLLWKPFSLCDFLSYSMYAVFAYSPKLKCYALSNTVVTVYDSGGSNLCQEYTRTTAVFL
jgi:hypothetical protein